MNSISNCCKVETRLGYKNHSLSPDVVIGSPAIICSKCEKQCEILKGKELRKYKLKKLDGREL